MQRSATTIDKQIALWSILVAGPVPSAKGTDTVLGNAATPDKMFAQSAIPRQLAP